MANEPERPIEKLLRAAAKKRRDEAGAPFELHPADRRLLQGEVARKFAKPQRRNPLVRRRSWANCGRASPGALPFWPSSVWRCGCCCRCRVATEIRSLAGQEPARVQSTCRPKHLRQRRLLRRLRSPLRLRRRLKAKSAEVAYAETAPPRAPPRPANSAWRRHHLRRTPPSHRHERQAREKLELAAPAQLADQQKQAGDAARRFRGTPAHSPAGVVNGALWRDGMGSPPNQPHPPACRPRPLRRPPLP